MSNKLVTVVAIATTAIATMVSATTATADNNVRNVYVQDIFTEMRVTEPYSQRECVNVRVGGDAAGGALMGMIIGGLIGKGATGQDQGAAAGAVLGGVIGANNAQNQGSRIEQRCTDVYRYQDTTKVVYDYSVITFTYEGKEYTLTFIK